MVNRENEAEAMDLGTRTPVREILEASISSFAVTSGFDVLLAKILCRLFTLDTSFKTYSIWLSVHTSTAADCTRHAYPSV